MALIDYDLLMSLFINLNLQIPHDISHTLITVDTCKLLKEEKKYPLEIRDNE